MAHKHTPKIVVRSGDCVLIGCRGITAPVDWLQAMVVWADREDIVTAHTAPGNGERVLNTFTVHEVRAVGDWQELYRFKLEWIDKTREAQDRVRRAEHDLTLARSAVWTLLEGIGDEPPTLRSPAETEGAAA